MIQGDRLLLTICLKSAAGVDHSPGGSQPCGQPTHLVIYLNASLILRASQ
jgi:hypothetical protein